MRYVQYAAVGACYAVCGVIVYGHRLRITYCKIEYFLRYL